MTCDDVHMGAEQLGERARDGGPPSASTMGGRDGAMPLGAGLAGGEQRFLDARRSRPRSRSARSTDDAEVLRELHGGKQVLVGEIQRNAL